LAIPLECALFRQAKTFFFSKEAAFYPQLFFFFQSVMGVDTPLNKRPPVYLSFPSLFTSKAVASRPRFYYLFDSFFVALVSVAPLSSFPMALLFHCFFETTCFPSGFYQITLFLPPLFSLYYVSRFSKVLFLVISVVPLDFFFTLSCSGRLILSNVGVFLFFFLLLVYANRCHVTVRFPGSVPPLPQFYFFGRLSRFSPIVLWNLFS